MSDIIRLRGRAGPAIHLCMVLSLVIVLLMTLAMPERCLLMVGILFFIELYLVMIPSLTCYAFDGTGITVRDPIQLGRSRVLYVDNRRVVEVSSPHMRCIQVWYGHGRGDMIAISPRDVARALQVLERNCPNAEFDAMKRDHARLHDLVRWNAFDNDERKGGST